MGRQATGETQGATPRVMSCRTHLLFTVCALCRWPLLDEAYEIEAGKPLPLERIDRCDTKITIDII